MTTIRGFKIATQNGNMGLDRSLVRAVAWSATAKWITQILAWLATIVIVRLLTPHDYGLVGMAGIYLTLATTVSQVGIADAVIAKRDLQRHQIAELNTVAVLVGVALVGVSCAVAQPLARFFSAPSLLAIIMVASTTYVINGVQVVPRALLQKDMRFKLLAGIDTACALFQMGATLALALLGFKYWSLIIGAVAGVVMAAGLTLCWRRHRFAVPHFRNLRRELQFSANVMASGVGWYVYSNADFFVAGRVLGQMPLGNYTVAWTISSAPIEKIGNLITNVTPAFFSAVQHDKAELRRYLLRLTETLSYATVPASIGLALLAAPLVTVLLGPKWIGVIGPLRLLGFLMAFRSLTTLPLRILTAIGETSFVMWTTIATVIVMPIAFFLGSRWGTNGIATAWIVVYPPLTIPVFYKTFQRIEMKTRDYLSGVMPALGSSTIMAAALLVASFVLPHEWSSLFRLLLLGSVGVFAYIGALFAFYRGRVNRIVRAIRREQAPSTPELAIAETH
jgi:O-antigen/teichoic acid export membrane protein